MVTDEIVKESIFKNVRKIRDIDYSIHLYDYRYLLHLYKSHPDIFKKRIQESDII